MKRYCLVKSYYCQEDGRGSTDLYLYKSKKAFQTALKEAKREADERRKAKLHLMRADAYDLTSSLSVWEGDCEVKPEDKYLVLAFDTAFKRKEDARVRVYYFKKKKDAERFFENFFKDNESYVGAMFKRSCERIKEKWS